jgi:cell division protein FtsW
MIALARARSDHGMAPATRVGNHDPVLLWVLAAIVALGLVMVYSASVAKGSGIPGGHDDYLLRQALFLLAGTGLGALLYRVPTTELQRLSPYVFLGALLLLGLVLIPGVGEVVNGSRRWIPLGFANFQPSELMKLAVVLYAADYCTRKSADMSNIRRGFLPMLGVMLLTGLLLIQEPDFGSLVVVVCVALAMLFIGGLDMRVFVAILAALPVGLFAMILTSSYRLERLRTFLDPWSDPSDGGFQITRAYMAIGGGGWFGEGLGGGVMKLDYLPEAHTDFIFAVLAEELGFFGVVAVIALYATLVWKAFALGRVAAAMDRHFASLVAYGIAIWLGVQIGFNLGVNLGLLPTKGITLPFMSYGGSSLLVCCLTAAVLLRIDYELRAMMRGARA